MENQRFELPPETFGTLVIAAQCADDEAQAIVEEFEAATKISSLVEVAASIYRQTIIGIETDDGMVDCHVTYELVRK